MRVGTCLSASAGLTTALALVPRDIQNVEVQQAGAKAATAQQISAYAAAAEKTSEFFNLKVDDECKEDENPDDCQFDGYAIKLGGGIVYAESYNKWYEEKLITFFVDSDTEAYTVSKKPLHLYVNTISGALKYAPLGWLPPNSISISFYKTGENSQENIDPSDAYFAWPLPQGRASNFANIWYLCPLSGSQDSGKSKWQVFVSNENFGPKGPGGLRKDQGSCREVFLAAINADPFTE